MARAVMQNASRSEEHTSELQSLRHLVCRLLLEKKKNQEHIEYAVRPRPKGSLGGPTFQRHLRASSPQPPPATYSGRPIDACFVAFFFFNNRAPPEIYPLPLHAALPF